jgi:hypothetical protein
VALAIASGMIWLVGTYTDNAGFQVAGLIVGVVALINGFNQARGGGDSGDGTPK